MAELTIALPNDQELNVLVADGEQRVRVEVRECACDCGRWFQPKEPHQIYFDESHRISANNRRRRKVPTRPYKK